jgi:hypothetical protein
MNGGLGTSVMGGVGIGEESFMMKTLGQSKSVTNINA